MDASVEIMVNRIVDTERNGLTDDLVDRLWEEVTR